MSSVAEAELGALYINAKFVAPVQQMLQEMGHPQRQFNNISHHRAQNNP